MWAIPIMSERDYFDKSKYFIERIENSIAQSIVVKNHYLHRRAPCSFAFGLREIFSGQLVGVIMYGTPSSAPLRRGICGDDEKCNVIELTRLWVSDCVGKNAESYLIGNTIKKINKEIVVSFSEIEQGHRGIVYQATNFFYTGLSAKRTNWTISGIDKHCQTIADKYNAKEIREKYGDKFSLVDRPRKHRYVFFNASKTRKKYLLSKLNYKIQEYPK